MALQCCRGLVVFLALSIVGTPVRAGVLGLLPPSHAPRLEGEGLSRTEILDRIDELTDQAARVRGVEQAEILARLAQLYISTGLLKHRPAALEYLDRALELDPELAEALHVHATMLERMGRPIEAQAFFQTIVDRFPRDPESHYASGYHHFMQARVTVDRGRFLDALAAFRRSVRLNPDDLDGWRGVAASAFAAGEIESSLTAAERLIEMGAAREGQFIAGATYAALQHAELAEAAFLRALTASDESVRQSFQNGAGALEKETAQPLGNADPTAPDRFSWQLTYWRRMVEADLLFGDPQSDQPGWATTTGDAWIRWGRPLDITFEAPEFTNLDAADRAVFLQRLERDFMPRLDVPSPLDDPRAIRRETNVLHMDDLSQKLHLLYNIGGRLVRLTFADVTFHYRWVPTNEAGREMQALRRDAPFVGEVVPPPVDFELSVAAASFLEERTGVAAQGMVVKGSSVDISELTPGSYRLSVTFVDRVAMRKITRSIEFAKLGAG